MAKPTPRVAPAAINAICAVLGLAFSFDERGSPVAEGDPVDVERLCDIAVVADEFSVSAEGGFVGAGPANEVVDGGCGVEDDCDVGTGTLLKGIADGLRELDVDGTTAFSDVESNMVEVLVEVIVVIDGSVPELVVEPLLK
jgi:hypothetical protein